MSAPRNASAPRKLTRSESDALGAELDALRAEVLADLGERDVEHIRRVMLVAGGAELGGRALLMLGVDPASFVAGTAALAVAKILENMEIGHNVMHGQYDWTGDPALRSRDYDWDMACAAEDWRRSHNEEHHVFTNVLGKDRDVGFGWLRVFDEQPWQPGNLAQPIVVPTLALLFEWGIGLYDLRIEEVLRGERSLAELVRTGRPFAKKAARQLLKDYVVFPLLALGNAPRVLAGNAIANGARNLWAFAIIFCGHFPDGVSVHHEEDALAGESRGEWYVRQLNGAANLEGGPLLHVMSGHLSYQIEHHLFPDVPASRYPEMAPRVREICERYGQSYATGPLGAQFASVLRRLWRLSFPDAASDVLERASARVRSARTLEPLSPSPPA